MTVNEAKPVKEPLVVNKLSGAGFQGFTKVEQLGSEDSELVLP